jgi:hypothetical protein
MPRSFPVILVLLLLALVGTPIYSQKQEGKTPAKPPELTPRRAECALFMPERGERHDVARLVRADQFLDCERDGYPKHLAPPWKNSEEGTKKLSDACEYFGEKAAREYPQVGQANLKLAADRCRVNVMQVILMQLVPGTGQTPK